jgi:hypothetical protein
VLGVEVHRLDHDAHLFLLGEALDEPIEAGRAAEGGVVEDEQAGGGAEDDQAGHQGDFSTGVCGGVV